LGFFKDQVIETKHFNGINSYVLPTNVKDVVTISGSILGGTLYSPSKNPQISTFTTAMLDKGTFNKDKYEISDALDSVGAELKFGCTKHHIYFTGHCLNSDVNMVIEILADQLKTPAFGNDEIDKLKTRMIGQLEQSLEDTKKQALISFLRILYPKNHPNYRYKTEESIDYIKAINQKDLKTFHDSAYGINTMNIAVAGDVNSKNFNELIINHFSDWKKQSISKIDKKFEIKPVSKNVEKINIKDKTSADMYLGQYIGIDREHTDYYPLMLGIYILGGNFSARLMQTVRDKQGLTYGIGSSIGGSNFSTDGYWSTWGTFAPDLIEKGQEATIDQINKWYKKGVFEKELNSKKSTITGSYKVALDTTGGLVSQILSNAERIKPISYLDDYVGIINNISLEEINNAISKYIDPSKLTLVTAGSFNKT
jgi:zinc protease